MNKPGSVVSIIVLVHNSEISLNECLNSLISQVYKNIEIIAVNNGSSDKSADILKEFARAHKDVIRVVTPDDEATDSEAINQGLRIASGEYIVFCDGRDAMPNDAVSALVRTAEEFQAEIVFSSYYFSTGTSESTSIECPNGDLYGRINVYDAIMRMEPTIWAKLFNRTLIDRIGELPVGFEFADLAWFYCFGSSFKSAAICHKPSYIFRKRNNKKPMPGDKYLLDVTRAERYGLEHCAPEGREIVAYHIAKRIRKHMENWPYYSKEWGDWSKELWPTISSNKYLLNDKSTFDYLQALSCNRSLPTSVGENDIKIFVSHRIDQDSEIVNNPLYINVRCGAIFDERKNCKTLGDNTGDNISEKRLYIGESTVEYWAWKNIKAEYYGLCHYRRYLSFSDTWYPTSSEGFITLDKLSRHEEEKYGLLNANKMEQIIRKYDMLIAEPSLVMRRRPIHHKHETVMELWNAWPSLIDIRYIDLMLELIDKMRPQYSDAAREYLNGLYHRGYQCYIMKRELFEELCDFKYPIMFEAERRFDSTPFDKTYKREQHIRTVGFIGEVLYGIFIQYQITKGNVKYKELQTLFIVHPQKGSKSDTKVLKQAGIHGKNFVKKFLGKVSPAYRVALRNEERLEKIINQTTSQLTASANHGGRPITYVADQRFLMDCFANELRDMHKASFSEFKNYHRNETSVVVACGPSMKYYRQIEGAPHIGVNAAFRNPNIKLDYYFATDYEHKNDWYEELKNYNFIKFFGQYPTGIWRDKYQIPERLIEENNARRFYMAVPSEEIHLNIEYYPLMGFYSIIFQAIHFALYIGTKRIILVGCDCNSEGYFDGSKQVEGIGIHAVPRWKNGYIKLKEFVERFYPDVEIVSLNPVGLRGMFHDVYTENYLEDHPEINPETCEIFCAEDYK